jgi:hypothetical protein
MTQATVDNNTRRRDFLLLTAAACTTVLAARPAFAATQRPDPIYAAIEAHKAAHAAYSAAVDLNSAFEDELHDNSRPQKDRRLEDEQRRGVEIEEALSQASRDELDASIDLLGVDPTLFSQGRGEVPHPNDHQPPAKRSRCTSMQG